MGFKVRRKPDFEQFLKVLRRRGRPTYLPFYEHVASSGFVACRTGKPFDRMKPSDPQYWPTYVEFWVGMGYDCIPMEIPLRIEIGGWQGGLTHGSEAEVVIRSTEDFERFPWPEESAPIEFRHFETVGQLLPEGVRIVGGVAAGPYEWVSRMMGVIGLAYALADAPGLVEMMFRKIGALHASADRQLAAMDCVGALRQGDDLGFKTATFLSPEDIRKYVLPIYRAQVAAAHARGKPFILHSCGNLAEVYEDLIACGIDAKHSFEETILPVAEFKRRYGARLTPLGGLDVDFICRRSADEIRAYTRRAIQDCFADGHWALGTGNSLTNYMPVENYLVVLETGLEVAGK